MTGKGKPNQLAIKHGDNMKIFIALVFTACAVIIQLGERYNAADLATWLF